MPLRRYDQAPILNFGKSYGTSTIIDKIRKGIASNTIRYRVISLNGEERLDTVAGTLYGDGRLWWIIAAASNIGFCSQVPPGTKLTIPNIEDIGFVL